MTQRVPFYKNIAGDFYVEDSCCTACDMPRQEAPDLFAYDLDGHCYVCKQPTTAEEKDRMANAMDVQELGCIRYKGDDPNVISVLEQRGLGEFIDNV